MKNKAARELAKTLAPAPPATHKRVGGSVRADAPAVADESELLSDLRSLIESARQRIASVAFATQALLCWHFGASFLE